MGAHEVRKIVHIFFHFERPHINIVFNHLLSFADIYIFGPFLQQTIRDMDSTVGHQSSSLEFAGRLCSSLENAGRPFSCIENAGSRF